MKNYERQNSLERKMTAKGGKPGDMPFCEVCEYQAHDIHFQPLCKILKAERIKGNYCATAYNRMIRKSK